MLLPLDRKVIVVAFFFFYFTFRRTLSFLLLFFPLLLSSSLCFSFLPLCFSFTRMYLLTHVYEQSHLTKFLTRSLFVFMSRSATATSSAAADLPYPNALQARHTTETHRRIAAAAVTKYQESLAAEQDRVQRDDVVLSEEEAARLQQRVDMQNTANAIADQFRRRACDVVSSLRDGDDGHDHDSTHNGSCGPARPPSAEGVVRDVYHAACDGDVDALAAWVARVPAALLSSRVNAPGQPDPTTYNGVQFQQRWLFRAPPLVFAAAFGREDAVRFLLDHGADAQVKSSTGLRAIDYAEKRGYVNIVAMLRGE